MQQWSGGRRPTPYENPQGGTLLPSNSDHILGVRPGGQIYGWRYSKTRENTGPVAKVDPLGIYIGTIRVDGGNNHFQGIVRLGNSAHANHVVWSGADWHSGAEGGAHLFFGHLRSRWGTLDHLLTWPKQGDGIGQPASNFGPDSHYGWGMPFEEDKLFLRMDLDNSTMHPDGSTTYWHAGGIQVYNGLLAVALENGGFDVGGGEGHNTGKIVFVDVNVPWQPIRMSPLSEIHSTEGKIGAVALTQNRDGHWIVAAWGTGRFGFISPD